MQGYDLDDTLARVRWQNDLVQAFSTAGVKYTPTEDFIVITAREHTTQAQRSATLTWLRDNQPHYKGIYYIQGGTEEEKAKAKARVIENRNLTAYTDNNRQILGYLKDLLTGVDLFFMHSDGTRTRY